MSEFGEKTSCPRCGNQVLKPWDDLTDDERTAASVMPASADFSLEERKKHRYCTRCWYEEGDRHKIA